MLFKSKAAIATPSNASQKKHSKQKLSLDTLEAVSGAQWGDWCCPVAQCHWWGDCYGDSTIPCCDDL